VFEGFGADGKFILRNPTEQELVKMDLEQNKPIATPIKMYSNVKKKFVEFRVFASLFNRVMKILSFFKREFILICCSRNY